MENPKAKGNRFEKEWAEYLRNEDVDATASRNYGSGNGLKKSDVHNSINYNFECKRVERLNIYKAIDQSVQDAGKTHSTPVVVFKRNREPNAWVTIPDYHFAELVKKAREPKLLKTDSQRQQYLLRQAKRVLHDLLKEIET